jgi:quercetin dioxygenase-like cupin family protein
MLPELPTLSSAGRAPSPATVHLFGNLLTFRARGADTQGSFSLLDCYSAPGQGAPAHRHEEAEAFFVLDGAFEISVQGRSRVYHQSEFAYVLSNLAHSFRNVGTAPGRLLIITVPAGLHEGFFADAGDIVEPGTIQFPPMRPPDVDRLQAAAARARMELLPPDSQD